MSEYDGLDLRDVLCICAILVAVGAENDKQIQTLCHAHTVEVLKFLAESEADA